MWRCRSLLVPQDAICTLNTLQTNASCLEQVRRERSHPQLQLQAMKAFLERTGLKVSNSSIVQRLHLGLQAFIKLMLFPFSLSVYITGGGAGSSQYHSCNRNQGQGDQCWTSYALKGHLTARLAPLMHLNCKLPKRLFSHVYYFSCWLLLSVRGPRARSLSRFWEVTASVQASTGETAVSLWLRDPVRAAGTHHFLIIANFTDQ